METLTAAARKQITQTIFADARRILPPDAKRQVAPEVTLLKLTRNYFFRMKSLDEWASRMLTEVINAGFLEAKIVDHQDIYGNKLSKYVILVDLGDKFQP